MAGAEERFHEEWLGMVQPVEGLVVSIPVLVEAQCLSRQPPEAHIADDDWTARHFEARRKGASDRRQLALGTSDRYEGRG
jgi:hypothetical protein